MKNPIIYNNLKNNFSQISNYALLDTNLSAKAYKLYAYMCYRIGLSSSWQFNKEEILKHFKEGESAMRSAFNELIKAGFLERKRVRNDKGIFERTDYTIYAEPVNTESNPQVENPPVDNPQEEKSRKDNPPVENQRHNNKDIINKEKNNKNSSSLPPIEECKKFAEEEELNIDVEKWYKVSKQEKINNWKKAIVAWSLKPENQITEKREVSLEISEIEAKIKREMNLQQNDYYIHFHQNIELIDGQFFLKKSVPEKFAAICQKFNLKGK